MGACEADVLIPAAYRQLFAIRATRAPLLGSLIGRLPISGLSLAIVLLVREETGSLATAGAVLAAHALGAAVCLPVQGRVIDRIGQTPVLVFSAVLSPLLLIALVLAATGGAAPGYLALLAAGAGSTIPALSPSMRTLWGELVADPALRQSAFALDAVLIEVGFISGPAIAAGVAATAGPGWAVLLNAAFLAVGTVIFAASRASREWTPKGSRSGLIGPLRSPGVRVLVASAVGLGFAVGAGEIAATAFAVDQGSPELAGALISVQAVASLVGGLAFGSRDWGIPAARLYPAVCLLVAVGLLPMIAAGSLTAGLLLIALSGFGLAPATAVEYFLIDELAPEGTATEAATWIITALVAGVSAGNAICGALVSSGDPSAGFALAAAGGALAFAVAFLGRHRLAMS